MSHVSQLLLGTCPFPHAAHPHSGYFSWSGCGDKDSWECHECRGQPSCWDSPAHLGLKHNSLGKAFPPPGASQAPARASPQPSRGKESLRGASLGTEGLSPAGFGLKALRGFDLGYTEAGAPSSGASPPLQRVPNPPGTAAPQRSGGAG